MVYSVINFNLPAHVVYGIGNTLIKLFIMDSLLKLGLDAVLRNENSVLRTFPRYPFSGKAGVAVTVSGLLTMYY